VISQPSAGLVAGRGDDVAKRSPASPSGTGLVNKAPQSDGVYSQNLSSSADSAMSDSDNADDDRCRQVTSDLLLAVNKAVELLSQVSYSQQDVFVRCHQRIFI
jgi:hypothetical protein